MSSDIAGSSYRAARYCIYERNDQPMSIEIDGDVIHMTCLSCERLSTLPRFGI